MDTWKRKVKSSVSLYASRWTCLKLSASERKSMNALSMGKLFGCYAHCSHERKRDSTMYVVYALIDPDELYKVCYIGMTQDVYTRFTQHLRDSRGDSLKDQWLKGL